MNMLSTSATTLETFTTPAVVLETTDARQAYTTEPGRTHPLGATVKEHGVNFALFSEYATGVELLLFNRHDDVEPAQIVKLNPESNKSFHIWHVFVRGLKPGMHYAYRVDGPNQPAEGHRFDPTKVLIDPYAKGNSKTLWKRSDACAPGSNLSTSLRSVVIDTNNYDWQGDRPLNVPTSELVIYEMHVGGFTKSSNSGVNAPGTFRGIIEKIPYLKDLGITAVELLPVFEFDDMEILKTVDGQPLRNYWGYSTMAFFAPHPGYCENPEIGAHVEEFRDLVKALHAAGISVILDVVFNHTDEGNHQGPTYSFKGIDNKNYYHLVPGNEQYYYDYTGCGNTFKCNHPIPEKLIVECLEYWVKEMHVDGFRFDEASVLTRGEDGAPLEYPPVIWHIELSEALAETKVFAEAWDAAGLYQIGYFPGYRWGEWNGRFRDDVRRFVKGEPGIIGNLAYRLTGSSDLYESRRHLPINSVNFITCHDGFTLNDLVSYNDKHNSDNGEDNRDGINDNLSWNCGEEGATESAAIEALRNQQIKNFATVLMLSQGIPMFVAGDEVRRTQRGNNNSYCQDNNLNWFDWSLPEKNADLLRFWQRIIAFRKQHPIIHRSRFFTGLVNERDLADISWHGCRLHSPDWADPQSRSLAFTLGGLGGEADIHVMLNMFWEPMSFELPRAGERSWYRAVDTAIASPNDIADAGSEVLVEGSNYIVNGRSCVVLISK
ncbi:MAG: glycogen debranching protein GlgX [Pirellulaceae bacterium]|nr:glycogen debranching protein GlgX [Pirellulaceae bacterium]